jgi:hypothetical protein
MHEETTVDSIFRTHGIEAVFSEIQSIFENPTEIEGVSHTLGFMRDASLYNHPFRDTFRARLGNSEIWPLFSKMLVAPNFWLRKGTIYTIAKLCFRERTSLLSDALPFYIESDVINLPYLLAERNWLGIHLDRALIEYLAKDPRFSVRWSLCTLVHHFETSETLAGHFLQMFENLKSDPQPLVSAEAAFRFERIKVKAGPKLPEPEWRKELKRITTLEPKATFERTAMAFMGGRSDYTIAEFEKYAWEAG